MTPGPNKNTPLKNPHAAKKKPSLWALVDCSCFYCSCERLFRPDLENKPVVVLSNNDGAVVAITPEAKDLGFKRGDLYFKKEKELKEANVAVFSSNYALYGDISRRVIMTMESVVPKICQYSIDEAFVPFTQTLALNAHEVGWTLHDRVKNWVGVPVRVGIGATRTLAKFANHWAKKIERVLYLPLGSQELEDLLSKTPVGDIWGIGSRSARKLERLGIDSALKLRDMDLNQVRKLLHITGQRTVMELRGYQCIEDDLAPAFRKTLVSSRSFGTKIRRLEDLEQAVANHAAIGAERLRKEGLAAMGLSVFIETSRFGDDPFQGGASVKLKSPTSSTVDLVKAAKEALHACFVEGKLYAKCGIMLYDLCTMEEAIVMEGKLFDDEEKDRTVSLMGAIDEINQKYGKKTIRVMSESGKKSYWNLRQDNLSRISTTVFDELPVVTAKP
ncbi:MAG: Y-family DNA polymerase [Deltaproteobacteria bacterium]|jgi:DNA polymerase V|nr:Y-family DNA polymerase [Deltaproteobacteria bacterium]